MLVDRGGFEPPKSATADLQSAPFGHSGTYPRLLLSSLTSGAGDGTRTRNLLITNQLLCQLSYASVIASLLSGKLLGRILLGRFRRQQNILYTFLG